MGQSDMKEIFVLAFLSDARFRRRGDSIIDNQSRIAGVCREIRCLGELELTLCSSGEQEEFFLPATFVTVEV